ncbi:MAG: InlB B-repeat-containing protein, partial [Spirochaetota bacterium]|nr:InlB B-repeat-containing protein [Spirochaetota bacterium]
MRKNYLMKSISIILMLLAMMFSCQPVSEDIDSGNSNSNNTSQGGNTGGDDTGNGNGGGNTSGGNENTGGNTENPEVVTLQNLIDNAAFGDEIDLSAHKDLSGYNATVNKALTIKNGNLNNATLTVTAENVKLENLEDVSVATSSKLSVNNSKLNVLSVGATTETSRSTISAVEMSLAMVSVTASEIENVELNGFNSQLNITDVKTKINDIVTSTKAKIVLEAGSYEGMKDPTVTDDGELTRIDMTKEKELSVLSIYSNPKKAEYQIGEKFDVTGLVVMGTYTASIEVFKSGGWKGEAVDSVTKWENEKDYTVTCEDFSTAGVKIVTITSNIDTKVKCNFYVYVKDPQNTEIKEPEITDITPKSLGTPKTLYRVGEKLDLSWIQVVGTYNDLEINLAYTSEPANGTTLTTVGETTVTLYYNDEKVADFPIIVENSFTVEFYDGIDNSKPLYTQKVTAGEKPSRPSDPVREDYTFTGWFYDEAYSSPATYVFYESAEKDIQLYAGWVKNVYIHDITIKVTNLPTEVKALSIWGTLNNFKLENIMADKDAYIVDVINGTAEFYFEKMNIVLSLWCQFVPMTSKDMPMSAATWWQTAFSGSTDYSNAENNLVYNPSFGSLKNKTTLTLDIAAVYADCFEWGYSVFEDRFCTEDYMDAFQVSVGECKYKIFYEGLDDSTANYNMTSFDDDYDVVLSAASRYGYTFVGWYETADFSGKPITGWNAGEKKADVTLYAKWEKEKEIVIRFDANGRDETTPETLVIRPSVSIIIRPISHSLFSHWNTKADGSGVSYYYDRTYVSFSEDTTLYAQWYEPVTITFNANGGSGTMENQVIPENKSSHLKNNTFTAQQGYFFSHWNTKPDGTGESYDNGSGITLSKDTTLYAQWTNDISFSKIYSYKLNLDEISGAWGGSTTSPAFSVVLLTDEQVEACKAAEDFYQATVGEPEYQISGYGNMKIADTSRAGDYAVYGSNTVDNEFKYYDGVAVTVTENTFELFVDMSKIAQTQLWAHWVGNNQAHMTEYDIVDLTGYKPYVIALGQKQFDSDNYVFTAWSADVMKMTLATSFPTDPVNAAPKVLTYYDLKYIVGTMTDWAHTELTSNTFTFTAAGDDEFKFTSGTWDLAIGAAYVTALNTEFKLQEYANYITFADSLLTVGNEYTINLRVTSENEAYVKITPKGADYDNVVTQEVKASELVDTIAELSAGAYELVVTGTMDSSILANVKTAMIGNSAVEIALDLGGTTGLTEIPDSAFSGCKLTSIVIPEGVTSIGLYALNSVRDSVTIPKSMTFMGQEAFGGIYNENLNVYISDLAAWCNIDIGGSVDYCGSPLFNGGKLYLNGELVTDLVIPDGVTSINSEVFYGYTYLKSVTIPDSVTSIGWWAFCKCDNLESVSFGNGIKDMGMAVFDGCDKLSYNEYDNGLYLGNTD